MLVSQEFVAVKLWEQTEPTQHLPCIFTQFFPQFFLHTPAFSQPTTSFWRDDRHKLSCIFLFFVFEADLSEGDGPAVPHL